MNLLFFSGFMVFVVVMLALDLFVFHKKDHVVGVKEAAVWTAIWVGLAMGFAVLVYLFGDWMMPPADAGVDLAAYRREMTSEFLAGYFLEESLSIDNIFVMIMIFVSFGIQKEYYHRVLFWGIFGAIVLRFIFIFALGALVTKFAWLLAVFGAILIYSGIKMFRDKGDEQIDTAQHPVVRFASKYFPVTSESHGHDFFHAGKMTPLFLVLLVIEFSDIIFAVDSIPAVFSVTQNPVIVYTSNIFAIMGLRSLFFLLSDVADRFWLLHYGLGALLCFIGVKMIAGEFLNWHVPTLVSLGVILGILLLSITLSMLLPKPGRAK
ncbi:MAG: TerC/Alx family metal homeostasis membrane protein [Bacteroidales bacterium]|nr:TerC/Alx family metal homeostasis membrane protein [Bacteroidales bacterium]